MKLESFADFVYLLLAAQGVFVVALLWTRRSNRVANRILAVPIAALSVSSYYTLYFRAGPLTAERAQWLFLIDSFQTLFGPAFYVYAVVLTRRPHQLRRLAIHTLPFVAHTLYLMPRLLMSGEDKRALMGVFQTQGVPVSDVVVQGAVEVTGLIYFVAALVTVRRYQESVAEQFSNLDRITLRWLRRLLTAMLLLWIASMFSFVTSIPILIYVHTGIAVVVYAIAYRTAVEADVLRAELSTRVPPPDLAEPPKRLRIPSSPHKATAPVKTAAPPEHALADTPKQGTSSDSPRTLAQMSKDGDPQDVDPPSADVRHPAHGSGVHTKKKKYQKARLSQAKLDEIRTKLGEVFAAEQPYLNPNLTLTKLAARLAVSPHQLSQVLSRAFDLTFHDYVNLARVDEMKRLLADPKFADEKILSLGLDCGFSSKSTLNNNFKKHTGMTPSQFRAQCG